MINILLTGGSGFIGTSLKARFSSTYNLILPSRKDLYNPDLFDKVDIVIHLAGKAHDTSNVSTDADYEIANTTLTNHLFDKFLKSNSTVFIFMSSILALKSSSCELLTEEFPHTPESIYAKSKSASELYIENKLVPYGKSYYILRTPLVYGNGNKGNLPLLFDLIRRIPCWPLGCYDSKRSFCDVRNLLFVVHKLIENPEIESGIYHIADNEEYDLNNLYYSISRFWGKVPRVVKIPKFIIRTFFLIGTFLKLPFNSYQLQKLTSTLLVSNDKIKKAIKSDLPFGGMIDLITSQKNNYD
jgi:nucleoside-diphosphate-sugar epimerase